MVYARHPRGTSGDWGRPVLEDQPKSARDFNTAMTSRPADDGNGGKAYNTYRTARRHANAGEARTRTGRQQDLLAKNTADDAPATDSIAGSGLPDVATT